jgi:hypothetical protein
MPWRIRPETGQGKENEGRGISGAQEKASQFCGPFLKLYETMASVLIPAFLNRQERRFPLGSWNRVSVGVKRRVSVREAYVSRVPFLFKSEIKEFLISSG